VYRNYEITGESNDPGIRTTIIKCVVMMCKSTGGRMREMEDRDMEDIYMKKHIQKTRDTRAIKVNVRGS